MDGLKRSEHGASKVKLLSGNRVNTVMSEYKFNWGGVDLVDLEQAVGRTRAREIYMRHGTRTIGEAAGLSDAQLLKCRNVGKITILRLRSKAEKSGLKRQVEAIDKKIQQVYETLVSRGTNITNVSFAFLVRETWELEGVRYNVIMNGRIGSKRKALSIEIVPPPKLKKHG
jgi:hypothetical protein